MNDLSNPDNVNSTPVDSCRVLCKGCKHILPLPLFLHPVDESCHRLRMQCKRCLNKSNKHWRVHRDDIKAARATRERDAERITCVCGTSINVRHRVKHCQTKRHLSVVAVLREHRALSPKASAFTIPASASAPSPAPATEPKGLSPQEELHEVMAAIEQDLAAQQALRERRRSLLRSPGPLPTTTATAPTADGLVDHEPAVQPAHAATAVTKDEYTNDR